MTDDIAISELSFDYARSSGPGGQNVNKVETKVILRFDVSSSPSLDEAQRSLILSRLATRISREGVLRVVCQRHRSQAANQHEAIQRFAALIGEALHEDPPRKRTRTPAHVRHRRLESKRRRSRIKTLRSRPNTDDT
jgi:ribosome-associated protein